MQNTVNKDAKENNLVVAEKFLTEELSCINYREKFRDQSILKTYKLKNYKIINGTGLIEDTSDENTVDEEYTQ
jgi:hypothetical protein